MERPFTAEIIGPAGAGKSSLLDVMRKRDDSIRVGLSIWRLPFSLLVQAGLSSMPGILMSLAGKFSVDDARLIIQIHALQKLLSRESAKRYSALMMDEGGLFGLAKLRVYGEANNSAPWVKDLFDNVAPTLDAVIWLDAHDSILARRIRERRKPHQTRDWPDREIAQFLARYRQAFDDVVTELVQRNQVRVMKFRTDQEPLEAIASQILATAATRT